MASSTGTDIIEKTSRLGAPEGTEASVKPTLDIASSTSISTVEKTSHSDASEKTETPVKPALDIASSTGINTIEKTSHSDAPEKTETPVKPALDIASSTGIDTMEKTSRSDAPKGTEAPVKQSSTTPVAQIHSGGTGVLKSLSSLPPDTFIPGSDRYNFEKQFMPSGRKSLAGIALRSNLLGIVSATSLLISIYLPTISSSPLWRIPLFLSILSTFHFLEFYTTAYANTPSAQISSFLLTSNGWDYNLAHASAFSECLVTNIFFPDRHWIPNFLSYTLILVGIGLVVLGQVVRSLAMIQAGRSFNHIVQTQKREEHVLVTHGIYAHLRHPSYFGFFWWGLGTQLILGNPIAFIGYAVVLHHFFSKRIVVEEKLLVKFFGDEYTQYREKTPVGIPLIR